MSFKLTNINSFPVTIISLTVLSSTSFFALYYEHKIKVGVTALSAW